MIRFGSRMPEVLIVGGGLAGSLAAWRLRTHRPGCDVALVEAERHLGGNHTWSFHATDLAPDALAWMAPLIVHRWPRQTVAFPHGHRTLEQPYCSVTSARLHEVVSDTLGAAVRLGTAVTQLTATSATLDSGEVVTAGVVIDARGASAVDVPLGWQTFLGQDLRCAGPHGVEYPVVMDATVPQTGAYKFIYVLPWSSHRLLVEDTAYADRPGVDAGAARAAIAAYVAAHGWQVTAVEREESGSLPIPLGGRAEAFWPDRVPRLGMRAGLFHPTTGYSLPDAVTSAAHLAAMNPLTPDRVYSEMRHLATTRWRERAFYRLLNRWLFRAAAPEARAAVLAQFYRRPADLIARFYNGRLTATDKLRLLTGRPPVPVWRALAHVWE